MITILENSDFHARSRILLALLSLKTRRQTRVKCLHTMIRTYFTPYHDTDVLYLVSFLVIDITTVFIRFTALGAY